MNAKRYFRMNGSIDVSATLYIKCSFLGCGTAAEGSHVVLGKGAATLSSCEHLLHSFLHAERYTFSVFKSEGQHKPNFYFLVKDMLLIYDVLLICLTIFLRFL